MSFFLRFSFFIICIFFLSASIVSFGNDLESASNTHGNETLLNTIAPGDTITGTITGNASVCQNGMRPVITLTGMDGTAPYTFVVNLFNEKDTVITSPNLSSKATFNANTHKAGPFIYTLKKVTDSKSVSQVLSEKVTITVNPPPDAGFSFTNDDQCAGTPVEFKPSANGDYSYKWDFGDKSISKEVNPKHMFKAVGTGTKTFNVKLVVTNNSTSCKDSLSKTVRVKEIPDAALNLARLNGATYYDTVNNLFVNCMATQTSPQYTFVAVNASTTNSTNTGYSIDWGDGTPIQELPNTFSKITHNYNSLGFFNISLTSKNNNGDCKTASTIYRFFNGNSPAGNLGSLGNYTDCTPFTLKWPVQNTSTNPPGTVYEFSVNDGSPPQRYDKTNLPDTIFHTFTKTSCGLKDNKFTVTFTAVNPCDKSVTTLQVLATEKPTAKISSNSYLCLNSSVRFEDASSGNYIIGNNCDSYFDKTWSITPSTGWTGTLTDNGYIDIKFTKIGEYQVKLKIQIPYSTISRCNSDSIVKKITINPLPTGTIEGGATVCKDAPAPVITLTGTSGTAPFVFTYRINTGTNQTIKTTSGNSIKIQVPTNIPGKYTYTLLSVQDANGCSQNQGGEAVFEVKSAPTATISGTQSVCQNTPYPNVTFTGNGGIIPYTFTYNIDGGADKTVTTTSGNSVTVQVPTENIGVFKYILVGVTDASVSACTSPQTGTVTITVNQPPAAMTLVNQEFCNGVATPIISFTNTVAGTTYSWTNSNTSIGLAASGTGNIPSFIAKNSTSSPVTSTITVTPKANGCNGTSQTFTITVNPAAGVIFTPGNQTICSGENTQAVQLSSNTAGATFSWTAIQPAGITGVVLSGTDVIPVQTLTNNSSVPVTITYQAKATLSGAATCAGAEYNYTITVDPRPDIKESFKPIICSNKPFNVSPQNGGNNTVPTGTKYTWSLPVVNPAGALTGASEQTVPQSEISQTLINTSSTTATASYTVTPSFNGCTGKTFEIVVSVSPTPVVNSVNDITLCNTEQSQEIVFNGSPAGTIFKWSANNTSIGIPASGVDKIPAFTAINTGTSPLKTTITVIPSFDSGGLICEGTPTQFSITVNPTGQVDNPGSKNLCNGESAGVNFTTKNTGGVTTYSWTNSNTTIGLSGSGNGNILFTPVNNGNSVLTAIITVTPTFTNNGISCPGTSEQFTITVNPTPIVDQPTNQILCNGVLTNEVQFSGNIPNTIFNWSNNNTAIGLPASGQGNILSFTAKNNTANPLTATITVTPSINGCNGTPKIFTITVNPAGILTIQPVSSTICLGGTPTQLSVAYTNGSGIPAYQWYSNSVNSINGGVKILNATNANYDPPKTVANTTYYYSIISFPSGTCTTLISDIAQVTINPYPAISTINDEISTGETFTAIPNSNNGDIVPAGTNYVWSQPVISPPGSVTGASAQPTPQTSISQMLFNGTTGIGTVTYTVTPTSGLCVGADFKVIVKVSPPMNTNAKVTPISCFGISTGSIETNIQGGVPISPGNPYITEWTGPNGYTSTSASIYNLNPGNYHLKVTDAIATEYNFDYEIIEPKDIIVSMDSEKDITCFGAENGEITISVTGGMGDYKYTWKKNNALFSDTQDITNLGPGLYEVTVTDNNSCGPKVLTFNITEPAALVIKIIDQTNVECFGESTGAVSLDVQGGTKIEIAPGNFDYKYLWTGPKGFLSNQKNLNNVPAGNYELTVTDSSGCIQPFTVVINQSEEIIILPKQKRITCFGANDASIELSFSGGVPPYQTQWDNFATGTFQDNLSPGDYTITVTDALNCKKTIVETVVEADIFTISPAVKHITCFGANDGSIKLNFEGGKDPITFAWSDNSNAGSTRNNIAPGTYSVDISEGGGCVISKTFTIVEPMPLKLTASISSVFDCNIDNGGAIDLAVIGGVPPYKYSWSNGAKTKDLSKIPAGNYLVTVTDSVGCSQSVQYTVNRPPSITINVNPKIEYCNTDSIIAIYTADVSGGVPPYQLAWSMGKISGIHNEIMETNLSGTVVLKVIDNANCLASKTFQTKIPKLGISDSLLNCNQHKYQFNALVANEGLEVYSYQWDFGDGTNSTIKNPEHLFPSEGVFKVLLTITNITTPCVSVYERIIKVEPRPNVKIEGPEKFCEGTAIILNAQGTDTYTWSDGTKNDSILITQDGVYNVTGTSVAGCSNTDTHSVSFFESLNYRIESDKEEVTLEDRVVTFSTKYTPDTYYSWDFGDDTPKFEGVGLSNTTPHQFNIKGDGYFDVKLWVTNPYRCIEEDSLEIGVNLISIPNTFTPNGDGKNDFYLEGWNKKIFNRNGVLLFEGTKAWDGNYNGKPVANDTYFVIVYDSAESGSTYRTNYITVLR